jgi:hypothetical protein
MYSSRGRSPAPDLSPGVSRRRIREEEMATGHRHTVIDALSAGHRPRGFGASAAKELR